MHAEKQRNLRIFVGLSGGVDSSVTALRLKNRGFAVVGVFIKTWQPDFLTCNWEAERLDAMRVAAHLEIPFYTCDAEEAYKHDVAEYMIREYSIGRTPNPDVMCNKFVKFGIFLNYALQHGADAIATGHYAQIKKDESYHLYRGVDKNKDQSYFLWALTQEQLSKTQFPIGDSIKSDIRQEASHALIPTNTKADSQGICLLGDIDIKEFLAQYIHTEIGNVLDTSGKYIGTHDGALFYTIGQRHGFTIYTPDTSALPHYVVEKDLKLNTITVSTNTKKISGHKIKVSQINIIQNIPSECEAQFRYRQKPFTIHVSPHSDNSYIVTVIDTTVDIPSLGQSCVFYNGNECLGGGIIEEIIS